LWKQPLLLTFTQQGISLAAINIGVNSLIKKMPAVREEVLKNGKEDIP
jgi:hypothetical protein